MYVGNFQWWELQYLPMIRSSLDFALGRILDHRSMVKQVATLLNWDVSELITADNNTASIKPRRPECITRKLYAKKNGHADSKP